MLALGFTTEGINQLTGPTPGLTLRGCKSHSSSMYYLRSGLPFSLVIELLDLRHQGPGYYGLNVSLQILCVRLNFQSNLLMEFEVGLLRGDRVTRALPS